MNTFTHTARSQRGFTLIELMIAMVISLVLVAGAFGIVVSSNNTKEKTQANTDLLGSTRLIAGVLGEDIRHAGMFGRMRGARSIEGRLGAANELAAATGDCSDRFYINLDQYIFATNDTNPWSATCVGSSYVTDTDILVLKYTELENRPHAEWSTLPENSVYLFSNPSGGRLFWEGTNPPTTIGYGTGFAPEAERLINPLRVYIYYLSEPKTGVEERSLIRVGLSPDSGTLYEEEIIAEGVEDFQVQIGMEDCNTTTTPCEGRVTEYRDADDVDWTDVTTVDRIRAVRVLTTAGSSKDWQSTGATRDYSFGDLDVTADANTRVWQGTFQVRNSL